RAGETRYAARTAGSSTAGTSTTLTSEALDVRNDAPAHRLVGHGAARSTHVFAHVRDPGRRRNRTRHGGMRDDELEQHLRPTRTAEIRRPRGQRMACDGVDQRTLPERAVHDDADAALARERQDARFDFTVDGVVRHLHEVERMARHDLLDIAVAPPFRR